MVVGGIHDVSASAADAGYRHFFSEFVGGRDRNLAQCRDLNPLCHAPATGATCCRLFDQYAVIVG